MKLPVVFSSAIRYNKSTVKKPKLLIPERRMNMKRLIALLTTVVVTAVYSAFSSPDATAEESHHDNVLITFFQERVKTTMLVS